MRKSTVFMFSGQGSQYYQMGVNLFQNNSLFKNEMLRLDKIAKDINGRSILDELYKKDNNRAKLFDDITYTHPAIVMLEYAMAHTLMGYNVEPDYLLGASLGEFVSLAVAGVVEVETMMEMVITQAECIASQCELGNMVAIIGDKNLYENQPILYEHSELVSINFDSHFVVSITRDRLDRVVEWLRREDIIYQVLPVNYAFHSPHINYAKYSYKTYLETKTYDNPAIPCISCATGKNLNMVNHDYLWDVIRSPIRFTDALNFLEDKGEYVYLDLGPSGTLTNFAKYNLNKVSGSECYPILTPFETGTDNLSKVLKRFK
ncbi:MAG: acyltransferase domain-containing protein [Clostridia bacterium]|nr:acyltransferase domain-containing protein [Clostridia bacterium]